MENMNIHTINTNIDTHYAKTITNYNGITIIHLITDMLIYRNTNTLII
jgi:hypothetical protein